MRGHGQRRRAGVRAGGLRNWLVDHHGDLGSVRLRVPVSLHQEGDDAATATRSSRSRSHSARRTRDPAARGPPAKTSESGSTTPRRWTVHARPWPHLAPIDRRLPTGSRRARAASRSAVSNVPGPRRPVSVLGSAVESVHSLAEIGEPRAPGRRRLDRRRAVLRLLCRSGDRRRSRSYGGGGRGRGGGARGGRRLAAVG